MKPTQKTEEMDAEEIFLYAMVRDGFRTWKEKEYTRWHFDITKTKEVFDKCRKSTLEECVEICEAKKRELTQEMINSDPAFWLPHKKRELESYNEACDEIIKSIKALMNK